MAIYNEWDFKGEAGENYDAYSASFSLIEKTIMYAQKNALTRVVWLVLILLLVVPIALQVRADHGSEYHIKASFMYNFIRFVDWPKEKMADSNEPIAIGILGKDPFSRAFEPLKDWHINGRKVVVKRFKGFEELKKSGEKGKAELQRTINTIRKCYVLFICYSEKEMLTEAINSVKGHPVLTVGDMKGFLETGGIINFVMEEKKVRFEINIRAAKRAKLKISSRLLRLAKRVIEDKSPGDTKE